jgi:cell division protein FtsL
VSSPARRLVTPPEGVPTPTPPAQQRPSTPPRRPVHPEAPRARGRRRCGTTSFALPPAPSSARSFGIVVLNALLAQTSVRIDQADRRMQELSQEHLALVREQATLSAPGRIAAWASRHGMRLPDDIRILHAPGVGSADPAGAGTSSQATGGPGA